MSSREQIVIIDDEEHVRHTLRQTLETEGFTCRTFGSAREALRELSDMMPIAAFVDVRMPDMGGIEFLHELRKSKPSLPVIVMTGHAEEDVFRQALQYKIADFLAKPFGPSVIRDSLAKVLGRDEAFTDHFLETVTHRLRESRLRLGLKQSEVASRCGMSISQVSQIELRQSAPSLASLLRLCKALNMTMSELVEGF